MTLEAWSHVATIAQVPLIVISLAFIWRQVRQATELARAEHAQRITEHAFGIVQTFVQDVDLTRIWMSDPRTLDRTDRYRYDTLLIQWLLLHETIFKQRERGLIDHQVYSSWELDLKRVLLHHDPEDPENAWLASMFSCDFVAHMEALRAVAPAGQRVTPKSAAGGIKE